jgi:hypothetical protein
MTTWSYFTLLFANAHISFDRLFLEKYGENVSKKLPPNSVDLVGWSRAIVEHVTSSYTQQVQELMETAQQMDTALQRRSKLRSTPAQGTPGAVNAASMTDSEKIALQMLLDVQHFGAIVRDVCGIDPMELPSYQKLMHEVTEGKRIIESK